MGLYDAEIFIIPPDTQFHSLKSLAQKSFDNNSVFFKYDSFSIYTTKQCLIRLDNPDDETGDIEIGGDLNPNFISIPSAFGIEVRDIFIKVLDTTDAKINFIGRGTRV
jgi:hypothetical protein